MNERNQVSVAEDVRSRVAACLLREGLGVYAPVVDTHGIDFLIGRADGTLDEIQVTTASRGRCFRVTTSDAPEHEGPPRRWLICVGVGDEAWVIPSQAFFAHATRARDARGAVTYDLDLDATPRGTRESNALRLAAYRDAWALLREGARSSSDLRL